MTTDLHFRQQLTKWLSWIRRSRGVQFVLGILDNPLEVFVELVKLSILTGCVGATLILLAPYLLNLPEVVGREIAGWCIERGSCDLTTNLVSVAFGTYLSLSVAVLLIYSIHRGVNGPSERSIYYDVREEIERAGEAGVEPIKIAKRTGIDLSDVHTMLAYLFDDAEVEVCQNGAHGVHVGRVRYRLVKDK